ncbi:hypothetical protein CXG81DRAFT_18265 [Caulochytrium protostelioides]|uniref:Uncharacterized protein n=1 Tax=Caulochytrium protostelioides TaxID=1555241 RepID=A0A4P9WWT1_9FUNG|nr:hypothetical protein CAUPRSCDRAFT_11544 [Caulochytrium protostelioides]RKP02030.1 hypothetical protein CXG81DRAFT_18265 [Caulochytrium protostelioides]|eukprot:RKP02030.1 hypothetical protein CXG81DRAFT_18265 [Caulochytrium protostelioides]
MQLSSFCHKWHGLAVLVALVSLGAPASILVSAEHIPSELKDAGYYEVHTMMGKQLRADTADYFTALAPDQAEAILEVVGTPQMSMLLGKTMLHIAQQSADSGIDRVALVSPAIRDALTEHVAISMNGEAYRFVRDTLHSRPAFPNADNTAMAHRASGSMGSGTRRRYRRTAGSPTLRPEVFGAVTQSFLENVKGGMSPQDLAVTWTALHDAPTNHVFELSNNRSPAMAQDYTHSGRLVRREIPYVSKVYNYFFGGKQSEVPDGLTASDVVDKTDAATATAATTDAKAAAVDAKQSLTSTIKDKANRVITSMTGADVTPAGAGTGAKDVTTAASAATAGDAAKTWTRNPIFKFKQAEGLTQVLIVVGAVALIGLVIFIILLVAGVFDGKKQQPAVRYHHSH